MIGRASYAGVGKRLAMAGGLGFLAALASTYALLGVTTLSALGTAAVTHALGMTLMIWAIVGAVIALPLPAPPLHVGGLRLH